MSSHTLSNNKHHDTNALTHDRHTRPLTRPVRTPFNTASSHFLQRGWCDVTLCCVVCRVTDTSSCYHRHANMLSVDSVSSHIHIIVLSSAGYHQASVKKYEHIDTRTVNNYKSMYLIHRPLESILGHGMTSESATFSRHLVHHIVSSTDTSTSYQHLASPTHTSACYLNLVTLKLRFPCTLFNTAGMHSL